jgi:membrane protein
VTSPTPATDPPPSAGVRSPRSRAGRLIDRVLLTSWRSIVEFVDDRAHRPAAEIAFFAALSSIPLALLLVGSFGVVIENADVRGRVIDTAFEYIPLANDSDRALLERTIAESLAGAGRLGVVSVLLLVAAATGIMSALRKAINTAWDIEASPPLVRRKLFDLALVVGGTGVLAVSLSVTVPRRAAALADRDEAGFTLAATLLDALGDVIPFALTALVILFLYRVLPVERPKVREIWPGALVAAALLVVVKGALELYFEHLADFGALYGSLGALMALLLFFFGASNVLVFGAEFASEWSRLPSDEECGRIVARARGRARGVVRRRRM